MATKTSLASAIRTAATQVSGASTASATVNRNYASSRIGLGLGPGVTRTASMNTVTTAPNFYSPFLTPSSFQIPNARREVYLWANWWRNNEPKISAAINFYTNYPFSGWKLECSSSYVKDYFEKLVEKLPAETKNILLESSILANKKGINMNKETSVSLYYAIKNVT